MRGMTVSLGFNKPLFNLLPVNFAYLDNYEFLYAVVLTLMLHSILVSQECEGSSALL